MSFKSKFYGPDVKNITEISFCIYTNDMIKKYSAVKSDPFGINGSLFTAEYFFIISLV